MLEVLACRLAKKARSGPGPHPSGSKLGSSSSSTTQGAATFLRPSVHIYTIWFSTSASCNQQDSAGIVNSIWTGSFPSWGLAVPFCLFSIPVKEWHLELRTIRAWYYYFFMHSIKKMISQLAIHPQSFLKPGQILTSSDFILKSVKITQ